MAIIDTANDKWCALPWIHVCIRTDDSFKPCCRYLPNEHKDFSLVNFDMLEKQGKDAMNHEYWKKLRKDMLSGEKREECKKCYIQEENQDAFTSSMRLHMNKRFSSVISREQCTENFDEVRYIEFSIDNICNLQCKMCTSMFSSRLQARDKVLGLPIHKKLEPQFNKFDNVDLSKLMRVKILGGEPFITPNFPIFIDYLLERVDPSKVTLDIITNGTTVPDAELIEKLNKFEKLDMWISLDSFDKSNDYQRYGSSYLETFENARTYERIFKNAEIQFHSVISLLNGNTLSNTLNVLATERHLTLRDGHHQKYFVSVDFVRDPDYLSILHAPPSYIEWILDLNKDNERAIRLIKGFTKNAKYNQKIWDAFLDNVIKLDKYYGTNLKDFNEPLLNFISSC